MYKAIFFDLDGTLLPLNEEEFTKGYFHFLCEKMSNYGYDKNELINLIWAGTKEMYKNDGSKTNEQVFWDYASSVLKNIKKDKCLFDEFYLKEFKKTKIFCKENPYVREIIEFCKNNFEYVILATNPIFPKHGTLTRMSFIGLKEEDFDYISYYENSNYTKPNLNYYKDILDKFNLDGNEVLMFGNNELEDGVAINLGINVYMVGDYVIKHNKNLKHIRMQDVIETVKKELKENLKC